MSGHLPSASREAYVGLFREAMQLRGRGLKDGDYYDEAKRIKNEMLKMEAIAKPR